MSRLQSEVAKVFKELGLDTQEKRDRFLRLIGEEPGQKNVLFITRLSNVSEARDGDE